MKSATEPTQISGSSAATSILADTSTLEPQPPPPNLQPQPTPHHSLILDLRQTIGTYPWPDPEWSCRCISYVNTWPSLASPLTSFGAGHTLKGNSLIKHNRQGCYSNNWGTQPAPETAMIQSREEALPHTQHRLLILHHQSHPTIKGIMTAQTEERLDWHPSETSPHTKNMRLMEATQGHSHVKLAIQDHNR